MTLHLNSDVIGIAQYLFKKKKAGSHVYVLYKTLPEGFSSKVVFENVGIKSEKELSDINSV